MLVPEKHFVDWSSLTPFLSRLLPLGRSVRQTPAKPKSSVRDSSAGDSFAFDWYLLSIPLVALLVTGKRQAGWSPFSLSGLEDHQVLRECDLITTAPKPRVSQLWVPWRQFHVRDDKPCALQHRSRLRTRGRGRLWLSEPLCLILEKLQRSLQVNDVLFHSSILPSCHPSHLHSQLEGPRESLWH